MLINRLGEKKKELENTKKGIEQKIIMLSELIEEMGTDLNDEEFAKQLLSDLEDTTIECPECGGSGEYLTLAGDMEPCYRCNPKGFTR